MQEVKIILITISFILIWVDSIPTFPIRIVKRIRMKLNFKPFNCTNCLSFWIGLILAVVFLEPIYLAMPLFTKAVENNIY